MPAGLFAVVFLEELPPFAAGELAGELAGPLGRLPFDVTNAFKRSPQLPFEDLSAEQAAEAVRLLLARGLRCTAVPAEKLGPFPRIRWTHRAVAGEGGLGVQTDYVNQARCLPWANVAAVSAATLSESRQQPEGRPSLASEITSAAAGAAIGFSLGLPGMGFPARKSGTPAPAPRVETYAVLAVAPFGADLEIRFRADQLNYSYLGSRMSDAAERNFRAFVRDVVGGAVRARVSPAACALAETGQPPPAMDPQAFRRYNRWLALLAREGL